MNYTFGLIANPDRYSVKHALEKIVSWSEFHKQQVVLTPPLFQQLSQHASAVRVVSSEHEVIEQADIVISVGGDGTMLWTAQLMTYLTPKPILGINSGRLGFMANTPPNEIESTLNEILHKRFTLDRRFFLQAENELFGKRYALNEFLFGKKDSSAMVTLQAEYNGKFINSYWADGLLVASPTGSTAYNLSSGGPIVVPSTSVMILTPINPHTLTTRPMVMAGNGVICITAEKQTNELLFSYDGEKFEIPEYPFTVRITQSESYIDLIELPIHSYFSTLRNKLMWGRDSRENSDGIY